MRTFAFALGALAVAAFVHPGSASAQTRIYPWCALESDGVQSCSFTSFPQCQGTVSGVGGFCSLNPAYAERVRPFRRDR